MIEIETSMEYELRLAQCLRSYSIDFYVWENLAWAYITRKSQFPGKSVYECTSYFVSNTLRFPDPDLDLSGIWPVYLHLHLKFEVYCAVDPLMRKTLEPFHLAAGL